MRIEISDEVLFQEVSGETVLLDLDSEQYLGLDAEGTRVWQLIGAGATADDRRGAPSRPACAHQRLPPGAR